jgi:hypothetical protein
MWIGYAYVQDAGMQQHNKKCMNVHSHRAQKMMGEEAMKKRKKTNKRTGTDLCVFFCNR